MKRDGQVGKPTLRLENLPYDAWAKCKIYTTNGSVWTISGVPFIFRPPLSHNLEERMNDTEKINRAIRACIRECFGSNAILAQIARYLDKLRETEGWKESGTGWSATGEASRWRLATASRGPVPSRAVSVSIAGSNGSPRAA